ncbi:MAG: DNA polymerase III subunit gamma/tau [Bacteroidales bacterium]|nr:DNA polymerase III subunit gamma/tau [Bacteroidales bacterium]
MKNTFLVSARKYRPSTFKDVVGQDVIVQTLKNAILQNKVAQSFLFTGPRGVGKTTCARILAKTINCENITPEGEACNQCKSCLSFNQNISFNIYELDAASNNSVEDIRQLIEQVRIPPQEGKYKIYIIDEVHMLSTHAFNAFLKTLEEPPSYAKFILATTERHKILPTILSRCQVYHFKRISIPDMVRYLAYVAQQENIDAEEDALRLIASKSDGAMRDALSLFDQLVALSGNKLTLQVATESLFVLDEDYYFNFTSAFLQKDMVKALKLLNEILSRGFDGGHLLSGLISHVRYLLLARNPETLELIDELSPVQIQKYKEHTSQIPEPWLTETLNFLVKSEFDYRQSNIKPIFLENIILQLCFFLDKISPLEKNTSINNPEQNKNIVPPASPQGSQMYANPSYSKIDKNSNLNISFNASDIKISKIKQETTLIKNQHITPPKKLIPDHLEDLKKHLEKQFANDLELVEIFSDTNFLIENENTLTLEFPSSYKKASAEKYRINIAQIIRNYFNFPDLSVNFSLIHSLPHELQQDVIHSEIIKKNPEFPVFLENLSLKKEK